MDIMSVLNVFLTSVINFLPNLVAAVILLLIGWVVGLVVGRLTTEILTRLRLDKHIFKGKKPIFNLTDVFSLIFRWSIYLVFIQAAVETLGITILVTTLSSILGFIPGLIKSVLIIVAGYAVAEYIRRQIEASKVAYSDIMGRGIFFLIIYITIAMALPLLGIDPFLVNALLLTIVGAVGVGLAIAIGWGLKDTMAALVKKYQRKLR